MSLIKGSVYSQAVGMETSFMAILPEVGTSVFIPTIKGIINTHTNTKHLSAKNFRN